MALRKAWGWPYASFLAVTIGLCIVIDILQYSSVLSFLPQGLKHEGYRAHEISAVIGSYYWAGFLGGTVITSWQIRRVIVDEPQQLRWSHLRSHVLKLVGGLLCGTIALTIEGLYPSITVHFLTRLAQGFLGAFLFFFSFFLSIELFEAQSPQQTLALTMSSMALHTAEVFGPFFGAAVFMHWGERMPFFVLAGMSCVEQVLLMLVYFSLPTDDGEYTEAPEAEPLLPAGAKLNATRRDPNKQWRSLKELLTSAMLWRSVLVVAPAAMIKAALENILPLFADHKLKYDEFRVGLCFSLIAVAFLCTSVVISMFWGLLGPGAQSHFVTCSMVFLGCMSSVLLLSYMYGGDCNLLIDDLFDQTPDCAPYKHSVKVFEISLVLFGIASAGCFTPSGYLIGAYVDSLPDAALKDAANGMWNTLWEVGGCLGIALSGIPDARSWMEEQLLMTALGFIIIVCAFTFFWVSILAEPEDHLTAKLACCASSNHGLDTSPA